MRKICDCHMHILDRRYPLWAKAALNPPDALVDDYAQTYEQPAEVVRWLYSEPQRLAEFEGLAIESNVVGWVLGQVKVEDKAVGFDELMGKAA